MTADRRVRVDRPADGVLRVRLDRPRRRNAVDDEMVAALRDAVASPSEPVMILGSTDPAAFCSGGDLSIPPAVLERISDDLFALYEHLVQLPAVIVAAADGYAIGAGAQLLLCAELRIAGPGLQVSFSGARSGLALGTWGLPQLIGRGRALDLSLTGQTVDAQEALRMGLVSRVVPDCAAAAIEVASDLARSDPEVLARIKDLVSDRPSVVRRLGAERRSNASSRHTRAGSRSPDRVATGGHADGRDGTP